MKPKSTEKTDTQSEPHHKTTALTLHVTVENPIEKPILNAIHELLTQLLNDTNHLSLIDHDPTTKKKHYEPCPNCDSNEIREISVREEVYTTDPQSNTLEYRGLSDGAAILNGDSIRTFCPECDSVFKDTARHHLTDY